MKMRNKIILLINTGTPDKPETKEVRRFLFQFLNDRRVIDLPWLAQKLLVNLVIVPFRSPASTRLYKRLWTKEGSPLLVNMQRLIKKLTNKLDNSTLVYGAMRYGNPSLKSTLRIIKYEHAEVITILPLFPQYASSTTGSAHQFIMDEIKTWNIIPEIRFIGQFYSNPVFLRVFADKIQEYKPDSFDHIVFSYHGLPLRQIAKLHPGHDSETCDCNIRMPAIGTYCYKATCYDTTRLLSGYLKLGSEKYSTAFQSRMSANWLSPFTDSTLEDLAKRNIKRVLVVAPSFVSDCLETKIEIEIEYAKLFKQSGGDELAMVESLNDSDEWVDAIIKMVDERQ